VRLLHGAEDPDPVEATHPEIGEDDVVRAAAAHVGALASVARLVDLVPSSPQHHCQRGAHVALIIDDQNLRHRSLQGAGLLHLLGEVGPLAEVLDQDLAAGRLPDLKTLEARFAPDPARVPDVTVALTPLSDYDELGTVQLVGDAA